MNFYAIRDLRTESKTIWNDISQSGEVIITNQGRPKALMIDIPEGAFDEVIQSVRQAKAMIAFNRMRHTAVINGYMSEDEIETEINVARN